MALGERFQEVGLVGRGIQHCLEDLLHGPAVVLLECQLVGLGGIDTDEVGVALISLPVADALQKDLDEAEAPFQPY